MSVRWSTVPGVKYLWAWWRVREARLRNAGTLPPVIQQFREGELIPLKGFQFRVAYRDQHGIVLQPLAFTGAMRKRLEGQMKEARRVGKSQAV